MKQKLPIFLSLLMILMLLCGTALSATTYVVGTDYWNNNTNGVPSATTHTHQWRQASRTEATCTSVGRALYVCSCGEQKTEVIPKLDHRFGSWQVTREATCTTSGQRSRTCLVCGYTETETTAKSEHRWGNWKTIKEATCSAAGKRQRRCTVCGETETKNLGKTKHQAGEWTVTKEPTCKQGGQKESKCVYCGKKITEKLPKGDHQYDDWETVKEATDFSKGKKKSVCKICKKKHEEEFYPEGTLAADLDNDEAEVADFQKALADLSMYSGKATGKFDKKTVSATKKLQKKLGMKQDGVGWPGLLKWLKGAPYSAPDANAKLEMSLILNSEHKSYYEIGDVLDFTWVLQNKSKKTDMKNLSVRNFKGMEATSKNQQEIDQVASLQSGATTMGNFIYTVTKDDALAGSLTLGFYAKGKAGKDNITTKSVVCHFITSAGKGGESGSGGWTPPDEEQLVILKTVDNDPDNKTFFQKGEKIRYRITIRNISSKTVKNIIVTDELLGDWKQTISSLAGNASKDYLVEYEVKPEDLGEGMLVNTAVLSYTGADGKLKVSKVSVSAPVGKSTDGLFVLKTVVGTPKNKIFYVEGETVNFEIRVTNVSDKKMKDLSVYDSLQHNKKKPLKTIKELKPSETVKITFTTQVTKAQARIQKKVKNQAVVQYKDSKKKTQAVASNVCIVPAGIEGEDGVIVTKTVISSPENGEYYQEGEEIRYLIEVTNNTLQDIVDMEIRDSLAEIDSNGYRTLHKGEALKAGETFATHFSFVVGPWDVENTKVTNIASAWWTMDHDIYTETYSDPVTVPTTKVPGKIKAEPVALEGKACVSVLTAVGEGVTWRDLEECDEHTETAAQSEKLVKAENYDQAAGLWDAEIEELYTEWKTRKAGGSRRIAEDEEAAFNRQVNALNESLRLVCSEEEADAITVEERMDKCVTLCYELHTAPEDRKDSMNSSHTSLTETGKGNECARAVTYNSQGAAHFVDHQCESHTLTMQLTQRLLDTAMDEDDRTDAWLRAQGNWLLELDTMYDTWYLSADESDRKLIAADRMAFDNLIDARREALEELYPDDPATAAEVLANMIMTRTELVCRVLHDAEILTD